MARSRHRLRIGWLWLLLPACLGGSDDDSLYSCNPSPIGAGDDAGPAPDAPDDTDAPPPPPPGEVRVLAPNGGESVIGGDTVDIRWSSGGDVPLLDIELLRGGEVAASLAEGVADTGSFTWKVPLDLPTSDQYTVRITAADASTSDASDAAFTVANWQVRHAITVTAPQAFADHAVLVELSPEVVSFAAAAADGSDVRFASTADHAAGFDVPHFIETWSADGARVWVRLPAIAAGSSTELFLFYGQPLAPSTSDIDAVLPQRFTSNGDVELGGVQSFDRFELAAGHTLTVTPGAALDIRARIIVIAGAIDGDGAGFAGGADDAAEDGDGPGAGEGATNAGAGGGAYGGDGGDGGLDNGDNPGQGGARYGTLNGSDIERGSGGGSSNSAPGGSGGGAVILRGHTIDVTGSISVNGVAGGNAANDRTAGGGGGGGGVLVLGHRVTVTGALSADGGDGGDAGDGGGGGGGGRIKIFHVDQITNTASLSVDGGDEGAGNSGLETGDPGQSGTTHQAAAAAIEPVAAVGAAETLF